jgi:hypothetical protein
MSQTTRFADAWPETLIKIAGGQSLRKCCEALGIDVANAHKWIMHKDHPERQIAYELAYTVQADNKADQIDDMAQMLIADGKKMNSAEVQAYRTAIDALKWSAAIRNRKKYGEKQTVEIEQAQDPREAKQQLESLLKELKPALTVIQGKAA